MSASLLVDLGALALLALLALNGWRAGAVRTLVGVGAALLGLYLAAVGRAPITALISTALPAVDPLLIGAFVVVGGTWLIIWVGSWILGATSVRSSASSASAVSTRSSERSSASCKVP